jgi:hypothetical protein
MEGSEAFKVLEEGFELPLNLNSWTVVNTWRSVCGDLAMERLDTLKLLENVHELLKSKAWIHQENN